MCKKSCRGMSESLNTYLHHHICYLIIHVYYWFWYTYILRKHSMPALFLKISLWHDRNILTLSKYKIGLYVKYLLLYIFVLLIYELFGLYITLFYHIACVLVRKHSLQLLLLSMSLVQEQHKHSHHVCAALVAGNYRSLYHSGSWSPKRS